MAEVKKIATRESYGNMLKELAEEYNLTLVDTFAITKDHPEWYKLDGIHPDKNGQTAMAEAFAEAVMGLEK